MSLPDEHTKRPSLRPTRGSTLVVAGLTTAAMSWLLISRFYGEIPRMPWLPGFTMLALAALEFGAAVNTKARIDRRAGTEPVDPLLVARYVVLAKASALAGALFTGMYAGMSLWLFTERGRNVAAESDLPPALLGLLGAVALMTAGLFLERACRVPPPPRDSSTSGWRDEMETDTEETD